MVLIEQMKATCKNLSKTAEFIISFVALKVVVFLTLSLFLKNELETIGSFTEIITVENARRLLYFLQKFSQAKYLRWKQPF